MKRAVAHTLQFVSTYTKKREPLVIYWLLFLNISFLLKQNYHFSNIEITDLTKLISAYQERKYVEDLDYFQKTFGSKL
jgi:hypothetical protein